MFYNKTIELLGFTEGYVDDNGIYIKGTETTLKTIECDVQPYSSQLLYQDYGYQEQCTKRVFLEPDNDFMVGKKIRYNGKLFKIVRVIEWDSYYQLMLDDG